MTTTAAPPSSSAEPPARRERRDQAKLVKFTPAELRTVADRAQACGRPLARYLREAALGAVPRARRTHASDAVIRQLARLASRLSALAASAAAQELPGAADFQAAVGETLEAIRQLD